MRRLGCLLGLCLLATVSCSAQSHPHDATAHHSFADVEHWTQVFDDPERDAYQKPAEAVQALGVRAGLTVVDLGAGTGYFTRYLSAAVGDEGNVLAVDVEPNLLVHLRQRAEQEGWANVTPVLASYDNARVPTGSADVMLIVDTFHHIDDRVHYLERLQKALRPGGRIAVIDFKKEESPVGPPLEHRLARQQVVEEFELAGYRLLEEPTLLPYHYFLIFQPR
jgi:ubiquinone/menaquinone biosynthesis C-methylase UbiE